MPFEQTITIINNSGKIISTGKHLVGIFKEARAAYKEKKEALRQERSGHFHRAHTFHGPIVEEFDDGCYDDEYDVADRRHHRTLGPGRAPLFLEDRRRRSLDSEDRRSHSAAGSRHRPRLHRSSTASDALASPRRGDRGDRRPARPPLTANNLRTLTEISATGPSAAPRSFQNSRGLYAASAPQDVVLPQRARPVPADDARLTAAPVEARNPPVGGSQGLAPTKPIDMHLAYGDIPPDLASRVDLDPMACASEEAEAEDQKEYQAHTLVDRIEALLNEAQCIHHTAASIICHLQDNPEAAAAVALTLAELSAMLAKLSPAFLGVVKGGSPAVFALLASPQFLIGTSIAVGVTVIIFGGWKIIKRISEVRAAREDEKMAVEQLQQQQQQQQQQQYLEDASGLGPNRAPRLGARAHTLPSGGFDEALVLEEELSSIEHWRRGIVQLPVGEDDQEPWEGTEVDVELISPEAMRSRIGDDDQRTLRSTRTRRTTNSRGDISLRRSRSRHQPSSHREGARKGKKPGQAQSGPDVPERHGSKDFRGDEPSGDKSRPGDRHDHLHRHERHGRHAGGNASETGSVSSSRSSRHSGHARRAASLASESKGPGPGSAPAAQPADGLTKDKKTSNGGSMLKQLFKKKKDKDDKSRDETATSVLV